MIVDCLVFIEIRRPININQTGCLTTDNRNDCFQIFTIKAIECYDKAVKIDPRHAGSETDPGVCFAIKVWFSKMFD